MYPLTINKLLHEEVAMNFTRNLVVSLALFSTAFTFAWAKKEKKSFHDTAIDLVIKRLEQYGNKVTSLKLECMTFMVEDAKKKLVFVVVREKHDEKCGGDPNLAPVVARFKVEPKKKYVGIYDVVDDSYSTLDANWNPKQ
jgi:hypothetical protein